MVEQVRSTGIGMIAGIYANIVTNNIGITLLIALLTGASAYLGQFIIKELITFVKQKFKK
jgi:hypothetical protein